MSKQFIAIPQPVALIVLRGILQNSIWTKRSFMMQNLKIRHFCGGFIKTSTQRNCRLMHNSDILNGRTTVLPVPLRAKKRTKNSEDKHSNNFVDSISIKIKGGNGGDGEISLLSLWKAEFAGPDGGKWYNKTGLSDGFIYTYRILVGGAPLDIYLY